MLGEIHGDHQCLSTSWFQHLDSCKPFLWWYVSGHEATFGNNMWRRLSEQAPRRSHDFFNYVDETSKGWDEPNLREMEKMRPPDHQRGGNFALSEDMEMKEKILTLAMKVEELEGKRLHKVQAVTENPAQANPCINFQPTAHLEEHNPMAPSVKDLMSEYENGVGQYKPQSNAPYGNTYNSNWKNHPNLSWKPNAPAYVPPGAKQQFGSSSQPQPPPSSSPIEQAILNLSKVVGNFVEKQKGINVQLA